MTWATWPLHFAFFHGGWMRGTRGQSGRQKRSARPGWKEERECVCVWQRSERCLLLVCFEFFSPLPALISPLIPSSHTLPAPQASGLQHSDGPRWSGMREVGGNRRSQRRRLFSGSTVSCEEGCHRRGAVSGWGQGGERGVFRTLKAMWSTVVYSSFVAS